MLSRLLPCLVLASTILAQNFTIKYSGSGSVDQCLSVNDITSNPKVVINKCGNCSSPIPWQVWEITPGSESLIKLVNLTVPNAGDESKPLCLHAANDTDSMASVVSVINCTKATMWRTTLTPLSVISAKYSCLDLSNGNTANNLPNSVLAWGCNGPHGEIKDNQKWNITGCQ